MTGMHAATRPHWCRPAELAHWTPDDYASEDTHRRLSIAPLSARTPVMGFFLLPRRRARLHRPLQVYTRTHCYAGAAGAGAGAAGAAGERAAAQYCLAGGCPPY